MTSAAQHGMKHLPNLDELRQKFADIKNSNKVLDAAPSHQTAISKLKKIQAALRAAHKQVRRDDYGAQLDILTTDTDVFMKELEARLSGALKRKSGDKSA